jgi:hypothetical protein
MDQKASTPEHHPQCPNSIRRSEGQHRLDLLTELVEAITAQGSHVARCAAMIRAIEAVKAVPS